MAVVCGGLLYGIAAAEERYEFRGPRGDGHFAAKSVPVEWGPEKNVAWKTAIPGLGWSSPALAAGRVIVTTAVREPEQDATHLSLRVVCVDAKSGDIRWNREVFRHPLKDVPGIHQKNSYASPTPLITGDEVYVHFGPLGTARLDLAGEVTWRNDSIKYPPVHGGGGSPIVVDDKLIFSCDGGSDPFLIALDRKTGQPAWRTLRKSGLAQSKKFAFSTPTLITVGTQRQLISPGAGAVGGFDPATGREIWHVRYDGYSVVPRPLFGHGLIYLSTGYDSPEVLAIRPDGTGDVTDTHVAWRTKRGAPNTPSLLLVGSDLVMVADSGVATCVDAKTGERRWQQRLNGAYSASPLLADDRLYFLNERGTTTVLRAGDKFDKLAENALGERTLASPAVDDGAVYIRGEKHLYRIGQ